ncbi:MAG: hypothetical protein U1F43_00085 [Myxococcota bacterium]
MADHLGRGRRVVGLALVGQPSRGPQGQERTLARGHLTQRTLPWFALTLLASACGTSGYDQERERWTRSDEAYEGFEARLFIDATLKVEPFRRAYVHEYARLFDLTPAQEADVLSAELTEDRSNLVLVVALYTPNRNWNDLNPAHGFWEVRLQNQRGDTATPYSVTRIDARNPAWRQLYPLFGTHDVLWELRFERALPDERPLAAKGDTLSLIIAGAPVRVRLSWVMP